MGTIWGILAILISVPIGIWAARKIGLLADIRRGLIAVYVLVLRAITGRWKPDYDYIRELEYDTGTVERPKALGGELPADVSLALASGYGISMAELGERMEKFVSWCDRCSQKDW